MSRMMPSKAFPDAINNLALFAGVPVKERDLLLQSGRLREVSCGEYLFHHGDHVKHFYIICSGNIKLIRETLDGKKITTDITPHGKTVGKMDILQAFNHHTVSACAVDNAQALEFPAAWLRQISKHPIISLNILSAMSQYVHMVQVESEQKSTMSVAQRIGCFLQRLCIMHGLDPRGFQLPYSKALIASRLGIEPETFSRSLATLKGHGIDIQDTKITFCDIESIEDFVCSHCSMFGECQTHHKLCNDASESTHTKISN